MTNRIRNIVPTTGASGSWRTGALLGGVALAASFLYVRAKSRQAEAENPPLGKFVEADGVRLHYTERGDGPPVVLLHGNGVLSSDFEASGVVERLAERYRVISFDRPGYGYSERPRTTLWTPEKQARLLHQALQQIGVVSPIVVGHSWGTMVALAMALDFPDDIRGLVLLSGYYYPSVRLDVALASPPSVPLIGDLMRFTLSPLISRLAWPAVTKRMFGPLRVSERFRQLPVWMMLRPKQLRASAAESALMIPSAMMLSRRYGELKVPVIIIAGTRDRIADTAHNAERLHGELAHSELQLQPGVGHMTHYADPGQVVAAVDTLATQTGTSTPLHGEKGEARARASESGL